jgi:predicted GH43/DUF377 family glycosyl hydrolase
MRTRSPVRIRPDPGRVALRFFVPGQEDLWAARSRADSVLARVMALDDEEVAVTLAEVRTRFRGRHERLEQVFLEHVDRLAPILHAEDLSDDRRVLIGACFTQEYAVEGACVTNPSAVPHPDQSGVDPGSVRAILSVRGIGEGHRSSIGFRTAVIDAEARVTVDAAEREVLVGRVQPGLVHRGALLALMPRPDDLGDDVRAIIDSLGDRFDQVRLLDALASARVDPFTYRNVTAAIQDCRLIAERSYDVVFEADSDLSQRVLFPRAAAEWGGMEDARFVRFIDDDGTVTHYASYTAFDGRTISGQLLRTDDFCRFSIGPLAGPAAAGKGMALFPRRIDGRYAALVRPDHETLSIAFTEQLSCWPESTPIHVPSAPWELTQSGNAGSPIATDAGWLVLTHSVGPLRTYSLGALLLDHDDPTRVLGTLDEPLISPDDAERDGYVPNVVYSCGPIAVGENLIIPYGCADQSIGFASVPIDDLIHRVTRSPSP